MKIRIEGPYYGSYSLAQINRKLIYSLSKIKDVTVSFSATSAENFYRDENAERLLIDNAEYIDIRTNYVPDVVIRHTWPIESKDLKGLYNYRIFPWEETAIDVDIISQLNCYYDAIIAPSKFIVEVLKYNNVRSVFLLTNSTCTDYVKNESLSKDATLTYLHISSCFARKSPEILIESYCQSFKNYNDTKLIIKSGYNPHINVIKIINDSKKKYGKIAETIFYIDKELDAADMGQLVLQSHFQVYPSRGEGFGLPVLEAHAAGIPCIIPDSTALGELFLPDIDFIIQSAPAYASSHVSIPCSLWWEPNSQSLENAFIDSREEYFNNFNAYVNRLNKLACFEWPSWDDIAILLVNQINDLTSSKVIANKKSDLNLIKSLTLISTFNTICGIATFSKSLLEALLRTNLLEASSINVLSSAMGVAVTCPIDIFRVEAVWEHWGESFDNLISKIPFNSYVLVQHHTAFFSTHVLEHIINACIERQSKCILELHSTLDDSHSPGCYYALFTRFRNVSNVLFIVHSLREFKQLNPEFDLMKNLRICAHPFQEVTLHCESRPLDNSYIVCGFGFLRSHKGFDILLRAFARLVDSNVDARMLLLTAMTNDPDSNSTFAELKNLSEQLRISNRVTFITDFLDIDTVEGVLGYVDSVVFPYNDIPEGASGAVRVAISSGAAVICSEEARMFDELTTNVLRFKDEDDLFFKIKLLMQDRSLREIYRDRSKNLARNYNYEKHSRYLMNAFINLGLTQTNS
jgi:glycosyltransferase involved in cell wall biosynthesis